MGGELQIKKAYESILNSDFEQAIAWFEQAIRVDPNNADYHYRLSITCARSNRLSKAVEHASRAFKLAPNSETYRFHMQRLAARELMEQAEKALEGERSELIAAKALLRQATALDPLAIEAYLMLAVTFERLGEYAQALEAAREAVRLDPQHEIALALISQYERKRNTRLGGTRQTQ